MSIYVGNLADQITEEDFREIFSAYGAVKQVELQRDWETGIHQGLAIVTMETETAEKLAIADLDGVEWMGFHLKVNAVILAPDATQSSITAVQHLY